MPVARLLPALPGPYWPALLLSMIAGCGGAPTAPEDSPRPAAQWQELLAANEAGDAEQVARLLEAWPVDPAQTRETHAALTWRLGLRIESGQVAGALEDLELLRAQYDGQGRSRSLRPLPGSALEGAALDGLLQRARYEAEGSTPDLRRAREALQAARTLVREGSADAQRLEATERWASTPSLEDLLALLEHPPLNGPCALALADHFMLGEEVFASVLERWTRQGVEAGVRVVLLGLRSGQTRVGLRRVPAGSSLAEEQALSERAAELGLTLVGFADAIQVQDALGLEPQTAALLCADGQGRIVARAAQRSLDPRVLEPAFQRLARR